MVTVINVDENSRRKLLSICQDIIYLKSKGRALVPKHVVLGMTVRHLTGCSKLIDIISGLGHCMSSQAIINYDSDLTKYRSLQKLLIPHAFQKSFATCVFDNNDFNEQTLTGKGTTHCTTGIIVQRVYDTESDIGMSSGRVSVPKSRRKQHDIPSEKMHPIRMTKRIEPTASFDITCMNSEADSCENVAYVLCKLRFGLQHILQPSWTGFFSHVSTTIPNINRISYLPIIDGSPADVSVVNTVLVWSLEIADELQQSAIVVVMDEALYAKAQQIRWMNPVLQHRLILRMGEFHGCMCFLGVIGKRFQDGRLRDVLIESNTVAEGSVNGVLSGKHYNRSLRAMKIVYEAIFRLTLAAFVDAAGDSEKELLENVTCRLYTAFHEGTFPVVLHSEDVQLLVKQLNHFITTKAEANATFAYWMSFIEMVDTLLQFIRATRMGNWQLHLTSVRRMLPWLFAYDRIHYSRYLPIYWLEMLNLPTTNPDINDHLAAGDFVTQRTAQPFSQTPMDQTLE